MQPPGDPDVVAGVKGLYAGLLEKVEFTILQLSNWNLLHPELIRYHSGHSEIYLWDSARTVMGSISLTFRSYSSYLTGFISCFIHT
jgi:hypothetical protein